MRRSRRRFMIFALLGVLVVVVAIVGWVLHAVRLCAETCRNVRLADLSGSDVALSLTCPEGHLHQLVLGLDDLPYKSDMERLPFDFAGTVRVLRDGIEITSFDIGSEHAQWCNWLDTPGGICAFILSWHLSDNSKLEDYMVPGERYTLRVEFEVPPPGHTSLWLSWVQRHDRDASDAALGVLQEEVVHEFSATQPDL